MNSNNETGQTGKQPEIATSDYKQHFTVIQNPEKGVRKSPAPGVTRAIRRKLNNFSKSFSEKSPPRLFFKH